jgi:hypothetical protein
MVEKYGKKFDLKHIKRNLNKIKAHNDQYLIVCDRFYDADSRFKGKCRVCGSTDMDLFCKMNNQYSYYHCNGCNCLVLGNLPKIKDMYTDDDSANLKEYIDKDIYINRAQMIYKPKADWILEVCTSDSISVKKWTDVGCGGVVCCTA